MADIANKENLNEKEKRDKEYNEALDFLGLNKKEIEKDSFVSFTKEKNISDKVTKINELALSYKMVLEGKTYLEDQGGYKQTGPAIAGKHFIALSYGILNAYASQANLLTKKDMGRFAYQFIDAFEKIENLSLRDRSISEKDQRTVLKLFKDTLMNIGEIITGSAGNMEKVFTKYGDESIQNRQDMGGL